jgi:hypothetical protein
MLKPYSESRDREWFALSKIFISAALTDQLLFQSAKKHTRRIVQYVKSHVGTFHRARVITVHHIRNCSSLARSQSNVCESALAASPARSTSL